MAPMSSRIREAHRLDLEALVALHLATAHEQARYEPLLCISPTAGVVFRQGLQRDLEDDAHRFFIAEAEGRAVGFTHAATADLAPPAFSHRHGVIIELYVSPEQRGQGLGRRLFGAARGWFAVRGLADIVLRTVAANPEAQAFWSALGFEDFVVEKILRAR